VAVLDGRLGLDLFEDEFIQDPYPLYRRMLEAGPIHRVGDSGFHAVCGWDVVNEAVARPADFSSNLTATMTFHPPATVGTFALDGLGTPTQALATADDPTHAVHRKSLLPQLAAKRIRAFEPFIAETFDDLWEAGRHERRIEWMGSLANRLPMMIVGRIIGVPDEDIARIERWGYAATQMLEGLVSEEQLDASRVSTMELAGYVAEQLVRAAADPQDDLMGDLSGAIASGEIDHVAAMVMMITLFSAGGESTASLIGSAAWILATRPDVQRQVRDHPELLGAFLEEVLRFEPPFRGHYRHVLRNTTLGGFDLPEGSRLLLLWGAANRDPSHFVEPDDFRLDRGVTGKGHVTFGKGAHFCVGAALARLEAKIVIGSLLDRTAAFEARGTGQWLRSLLVRRLDSLELNCE
jgi:cytochrome P450 family 144